MAVGHGDLWRLAKTVAELADNPGISPQMVEPLKRVAVGRAYYAAYHRALLYATALGYVEPNEGSGHSALWTWYVGQGSSHRLVGNLGFSLHRRRKAADYRLGESCPAVEDQIEETELLFDTLLSIEDEAFGTPS